MEIQQFQGMLEKILKTLEEDKEERKRDREDWERRWMQTEERMNKKLEEVKRLVQEEKRERTRAEEEMKRAAVNESRKREELEKKMEEKMKEMEEREKGRQIEKGEQNGEKGKGEMEREKKQLKELEWRIEEGERERKRNNVVISGLKEGKWDKARVEEWLREKLEVAAKVKRTWAIRGKNKSRIGVECEDREEKEKIMERKSTLKGTDCFIDHDLTWRERRNKEKLNGLVREWRSEGKPVKVGRNKLTVGDTVYLWNEREDELFRRGEGKGR